MRGQKKKIIIIFKDNNKKKTIKKKITLLLKIFEVASAMNLSAASPTWPGKAPGTQSETAWAMAWLAISAAVMYLLVTVTSLISSADWRCWVWVSFGGLVGSKSAPYHFSLEKKKFVKKKKKKARKKKNKKSNRLFFFSQRKK
jgi:hypothetical protein